MGDRHNTHANELSSDRGHPMPRRTTPDKSVTLRHHRLARDASIRASSGKQKSTMEPPMSPPRRNSSGESQETGHSDPKRWFDRSNRNPMATFDSNTMDVDPPFFQKEWDSSNEEHKELDVPAKTSAYPYTTGGLQVPTSRLAVTHSSSADDFRSVIDDLTIENKRLKEELRRYKQFGPDMLRKEKLFEIKVHGLPGRKKRELETTLRNFAAGLEGSTETSTPRKKSKHANRLYSSGGSLPLSKHASSSSSHSRPVDSAYASASIGPNSSGPNLSGTSQRPSMSSRTRASDLKVEHYLQDIPEGLYPRHLVMTEKEKKKLIVKRLEQLFTGKFSGRNLRPNQFMPPMSSMPPMPFMPSIPSMPSIESQSGDVSTANQAVEPAREAHIQPQDVPNKPTRSRDNLSLSNSNFNGDQTESGGNGDGGGSGSGSGGRSGNDNSPPTVSPPEQRATRPKDLDPDRVQIPSENMEYIRHLGLVPPELLSEGSFSHDNVAPDADGWVYLNLLCNLAQLHILNVTPAFIRTAVAEKSAKFQLSLDGRKIRWRGGIEGTRFTSGSSGPGSQRSPDTDDDDGDDGSNGDGQRKRQKMQPTSGDQPSASSRNNHSKFGPQVSGSSESFHYKPLFVHSSSSPGSSLDETGSQGSFGGIEDSNVGLSRWDFSGPGSSPRKRRRNDGAIVYYSGAPFCTDLSGDPGDASPTTYMTWTGQQQSEQNASSRPLTLCTPSGSSLPFIPFAGGASHPAYSLLDDSPELVSDAAEDTSDSGGEFPWCDEPKSVYVKPIDAVLEPCGLGGVVPEDHFLVAITTRRPCNIGPDRSRDGSNTIRSAAQRLRSDETADSIIRRLAPLSTSSLKPPTSSKVATSPAVKIEYVSGRVKRLAPVSLPPPAVFYQPFSTRSSSSSSEGDPIDSSDDEAEAEGMLASSSEELISQRANPHRSDIEYPEGEELTSEDEEDEVGENENGVEVSGSRPSLKQDPYVSQNNDTSEEEADMRRNSIEVIHSGSSLATAGGAESGYISSPDD